MISIIGKLRNAPRKRVLAAGAAILLLLIVALLAVRSHGVHTSPEPAKTSDTTTPVLLQPDTNPSTDITSIKVSAKQTNAQEYAFTTDITTTLAISKVEFYANGKLIGTASKSPYTLSSAISSLPTGKVSIVAKAYDSAGNTKTSDPTEITITRSSQTTPPTTGTSGQAASGGTSGSSGTSGGGGTSTPAKPYVLPGSQGYKGNIGDLTLYTEANGQLPAGQNCSWDHTYKNMECRNTDLVLDHVYIKGGIYWDGCGNLSITNSIIDWKPSKNWHNIHAACDNSNPGTTLTISHSTLRASDDGTPYTGSIDVGGTDVGNLNTGSPRPMLVSYSLLQDFPQGLDPAGDSIIKYNEIYTSDVWCTNSSEWCHSDGLFSQGGNNLVYQGNYIISQIDPIAATAAIFFQSSGRTTGHKIIDNYIKGGAFTFYNQSADNITVENNTFGGGKFGDVSNTGTILSWVNNQKENGTVVPKP